MANRTIKLCILIKNAVGAALGISQHSSPNLSIIKLPLAQRSLYIACAYVEPNADQFNTLNAINTFLSSTRSALQLIGGDFNGWHVSWGSNRSNDRGLAVANIIAANDIEVCNQGNVATFNAIRHGAHARSIVDVTIASGNLANHIIDWSVNVAAIQNSDHSAITFKIESSSSVTAARSTLIYLYNNETANWKKFGEVLDEQLNIKGILNVDLANCTAHDLDNTVESLTGIIKKACSICMKIRGHGKAINPWWTNELEDLKKKCIQLHHKLNNLKKSQNSTTIAIEHSNAKRTYAAALKKASTEHFREFCTQQGKENVWSLTNRLIKDAPSHRPPRTLKNSGLFSDTSAGTAEALLQYFFPDDTIDSTRQHHYRRSRIKNYLNTPRDEPFTEEEVLEALVTMNPNRAPGLDNLTSDICLNFTKKYPKFLIALHNACLRVGYFPKIWKKAYIKILPKPNKIETNELGSYRPIGLLPVFGKLLEKLFTKRLIRTTESIMVSKTIWLQRADLNFGCFA